GGGRGRTGGRGGAPPRPRAEGRAGRLRLGRGRPPAVRRRHHGHGRRSQRRRTGHRRAPPTPVITFSAEQEEFRKTIARFVEAEVVPEAQAIDERGEFPTKIFKRLGELGYLGLRYPERYGGADADMTTYCLFAEELARGSLSVAAVAAMQSLMGTYFVYKYGSEALRARYLVPALRGELVATFGL